MSEALALVDLLVLVHARHYIGFAISSYSWVVQVSPQLISVLAVSGYIAARRPM